VKDLNAVKRASAETCRVSTHFNRAVVSFWPDNTQHMKTALLQSGTGSAEMKARSKFEVALSFRSLVIGAVCVWQECWNVLQVWRRKSVGQDVDIGRMTESLDELKTKLIADIEAGRYEPVVRSVFQLECRYIYLQARRMATFIKQPFLLEILRNESLLGLLDPHRSIRDLENGNSLLKNQFRIYQRDNIEDFLEYLDEYFNPNMKDKLETKTWLVCQQGDA